MAAKVLIGIAFVVPTLLAFLSTLFVFPKYDNKGIKHYFTCLDSWYGILISFIAFAIAVFIMLGIKE
jgi:hypothetical protein